MGTHMKTTIDIADTLLLEAKALASEQHTTLRELVEDGLRQAIKRRRKVTRVEFTDVSQDLGGLRAPLNYDDWAAILREAYGERF